MSIDKFKNLLELHQRKNVGDYVHIYHDNLPFGVKNNVLGKFDDHSVGKIIAIKDGCAEVQYGSETNIGTYDLGSLASVIAELKPTAINKTGTLGNPSEKQKGIILDWSNFGKGDKVKVSVVGLLKPPTVYDMTDLVFIISDSYKPSVSLIRSGGGSNRRVTLRKKKLPAKLTRLIKRV